MTRHRLCLTAVGLTAFLALPVHGMGYGDSTPRAAGLAGSYTALARGTEAIYWNPANLALSGSPKWSMPNALPIGAFNAVLENNSFSVADYNKYNGEFIDDRASADLLGKIPADGLKLNTDLGLPLPVLSGMAFPMPWGLSSAIAFNVRLGVEGEMPRDWMRLMLRGNELDEELDIAKWDGSGWAFGVFNWAFARPWMPAQAKPYFSQFTVGGTFKVLGGGFSEVSESNGGFVTRVDGIDMDAYAIAQGGGGWGLGIDLGAAGVTKDGKTTVGAALVNFLDYTSWSISPRADSIFAHADDLRVTSFTGTDDYKEILGEDTDGDGDSDFHRKLLGPSFTKSLPAMLRIGVARAHSHQLTLAANYDQAFSSGFGITAVPRLSLGAEYRLVDWFPTRLGLSVGGRPGMMSSIGMGLGPFTTGPVQISALEWSYSNRGGFIPGLAKGFGWSVTLFRLGFVGG